VFVLISRHTHTHTLCRIYTWIETPIYICAHSGYGVDTNSRLIKTLRLFCKRALYMRRYSAKETYTFQEPTNRSHPIWYIYIYTWKTQARYASRSMPTMLIHTLCGMCVDRGSYTHGSWGRSMCLWWSAGTRGHPHSSWLVCTVHGSCTQSSWCIFMCMC